MGMFSRLFESEDSKKKREAEEAKKEADSLHNSFWLLVLLESGMQGSIAANIEVLKQMLPGAYEEFSLIQRQEMAQLVQSNMEASEVKARMAAFTKSFTAELGAKAKELKSGMS